MSDMMRPAILFSVIFTWNATTGGRFLALYLKESAKLSDFSIGIILSIQMSLTAILGGYGGMYADSLERKHPQSGRVRVLSCGLVIGTFAFLLENLDVKAFNLCKSIADGKYCGTESKDNFNFMWHLLFRSFYAGSIALISPVLDGLTVANLKIRNNSDTPRSYGRERLHGAIWWAVANALSGICIDTFGMEAIFVLSLVSLFACLAILACYVKSIQNHHSLEELPLTLDSRKNVAYQINDNINSGRDQELQKQKSLRDNKDDDDDWTSKKDYSSFQGPNYECHVHDMHPKIVVGRENKVKSSSDHQTGKEVVTIQTLMHSIISTSSGATFLLALFFLNIGMSVVENLIFLFYESLHRGTYTMCGLSVVSTVAFEIPIFYSSRILLESIGAVQMLFLACMAFVVRTAGYMLIQRMGINILLLDLLHGMSYALSQSAGVTFVEENTPNGYEASGQGLLSLTRGVGASVGLLLGGLIEEDFGPKFLYGSLSLLVFMTASALEMAHYCHNQAPIDQSVGRVYN